MRMCGMCGVRMCVRVSFCLHVIEETQRWGDEMVQGDGLKLDLKYYSTLYSIGIQPGSFADESGSSLLHTLKIWFNGEQIHCPKAWLCHEPLHLFGENTCCLSF